MSKIRLNSIKVKNYRSFGEEQIFTFPNEDYKKPVAIVGYNNSGKTNLMNAILYGVGESFIAANTFEKKDLHNLDYKNHIEIKTDIYGSGYPYMGNYGPKIGTQESITGQYRIFTKMEDDELFSGIDNSFFGKNKHYNIFYINFHNIKDQISTKKTSWGNLTTFLGKHIQQLVDRDQKMKDKKEIFKIETKKSTEKVMEDSDLSKFIKSIKGNYSINLRNNSCKVDFGLPDYEDIFLQMMFKVGLNGDSENLVPIDHFGDGYISMFIMAVIQAIAESNANDKCLFLFEEPESFLHENHQEYFYKTVLCNLAERGHQVIYTTHSDKMVDVFDTRGLIRIEFDEEKKQTVKKYNDTRDMFENIIEKIEGSKEENKEVITLKEYNQFIQTIEPNLNKILFSRKVVLVEGPNDVMAYRYAIEKKIKDLGKDKRYANTYLNFHNIVIIPHHGKITALLLVELCKHMGVDYFAINDWDFDEDFINELSGFDTEEKMKASIIYMRSEKKGMVTTNWKLLHYVDNGKIHFNIPKLEKVLDYGYNDKSSIGLWKKLETTKSFSDEFFPAELEVFLEMDKIKEV